MNDECPAIPTEYSHLMKPELPCLVREGLCLYGVVEFAGEADNPIIMGWADEIGGWIGPWYNDHGDSTPWCGLWAGVVAKRAARGDLPKNPLRALDWNTYGDEVASPEDVWVGDVVTFTRNGGGHVGIYVGEDETHFHILGGNQSDQVNIARIAKSRMSAIRRPQYQETDFKDPNRYFIGTDAAQETTNEQ